MFLTLRISQDLAKDLAMLAREIHDVAGEIDSVSPAATDPGALVKRKNALQNKHKGFFFFYQDFAAAKIWSVRISYVCLWNLFQLEERVFEDSQEAGGHTEHSTTVRSNGQAAELRPRASRGESARSIRRQTWNREDVSFSNEMIPTKQRRILAEWLLNYDYTV